MTRFLCAFLILALSFSCVSQGESVQRSAKAIEGIWLAAEAELAGVKFSDEARKNIKLVVREGKYTLTVGPDSDKGTVLVHPATDPKSLEIVSAEGAHEGKTIFAIYEIGRDTLRICYDLSGDARPREFKTAKGSSLFLVTYRREKP